MHDFVTSHELSERCHGVVSVLGSELVEGLHRSFEA